MPDQKEDIVEYIDDSNNIGNSKLGSDKIENGNLENGKLGKEKQSDDFANESEQPSSALLVRSRPQSAHLSPYRETNLVSSPSSLSVRDSLSQSTVSLAAKYFGGISKKARNSEFGSMSTIPIIPTSGTYKSLQQIPARCLSINLLAPERNPAIQENNVGPSNIPEVTVSDSSHDRPYSLNDCLSEDVLERMLDRETNV